VALGLYSGHFFRGNTINSKGIKIAKNTPNWISGALLFCELLQNGQILAAEEISLQQYLQLCNSDMLIPF
jgi:hypothetical protein